MNSQTHHVRYMVVLGSAILLATGGGVTPALGALVAHWSFDSDYSNVQGNSVLDGFPVSTGTGSVSITGAAGEYQRGGGALKIDDPASGMNYVDVTQSPVANNQKQVSVVAWYRYSDISSDGSDARKYVWSTHPTYSTEFSVGSSFDGEWYFLTPTTPNGHFADTTGPVINDGLWHHVAMVWDRDANTAKYYHDGALRDNRDTSSNLADLVDSTGFHIGDYRNGDGGRNFDGYIDDVAVFDHALTDGEVLNLFHGAGPQNLDEPPVRAARVQVTGTTNATTAYAVLNESTGLNANFQNNNFGDHELYSSDSRLLQTDGVIIGNANDGDDSIVQVAGDLTYKGPADPRYDNGMGFSTADLSGGGEKNFDLSFAHFPFAGKWIAAHVDDDGTVLAGPNLPAGTTITPLDQSQARLGPGQFVVHMPGIDSRTDGMLFVVGGENDNNFVGAGVFEDPTNVNVVAGDASLGDWHVHIRDAAQNDTSDVGELGTFSFLYVPYKSQLAPEPLMIENLVGGRIGEDGSILNIAGTFTMLPKTAAGTYHIRIPDGQGGFFGDDDGILILTASGILEGGQSGNNIDPVEAGGITWQYDSVNNWFEVLTFDAPSSSLDDTQFVFAFVQYDNPLALSIPEPSSLVLLGLAAVGLLPLRRRRRR